MSTTTLLLQRLFTNIFIHDFQFNNPAFVFATTITYESTINVIFCLHNTRGWTMLLFELPPYDDTAADLESGPPPPQYSIYPIRSSKAAYRKLFSYRTFNCTSCTLLTVFFRGILHNVPLPLGIRARRSHQYTVKQSVSIRTLTSLKAPQQFIFSRYSLCNHWDPTDI